MKIRRLSVPIFSKIMQTIPAQSIILFDCLFNFLINIELLSWRKSIELWLQIVAAIPIIHICMLVRRYNFIKTIPAEQFFAARVSWNESECLAPFFAYNIRERGIVDGWCACTLYVGTWTMIYEYIHFPILVLTSSAPLWKWNISWKLI